MARARRRQNSKTLRKGTIALYCIAFLLASEGDGGLLVNSVEDLDLDGVDDGGDDAPPRLAPRPRCAVYQVPAEGIHRGYTAHHHQDHGHDHARRPPTLPRLLRGGVVPAGDSELYHFICDNVEYTTESRKMISFLQRPRFNLVLINRTTGHTNPNSFFNRLRRISPGSPSVFVSMDGFGYFVLCRRPFLGHKLSACKGNVCLHISLFLHLCRCICLCCCCRLYFFSFYVSFSTRRNSRPTTHYSKYGLILTKIHHTWRFFVIQMVCVFLRSGATEYSNSPPPTPIHAGHFYRTRFGSPPAHRLSFYCTYSC